MTKLTTQITVNLLVSWGACYKRERLAELFGERESVSPLEIAKADQVPPTDRLWVLLRTEILSEQAMRLFAADCAEHRLEHFESKFPEDKRPRKAIEAARDFANGKIDRATMIAERREAWKAYDAAYAAAAAYAADADDAADADAADARKAERDWQLDRLCFYLGQAAEEASHADA